MASQAVVALTRATMGLDIPLSFFGPLFTRIRHAQTSKFHQAHSHRHVYRLSSLYPCRGPN